MLGNKQKMRRECDLQLFLPNHSKEIQDRSLIGHAPIGGTGLIVRDVSSGHTRLQGWRTVDTSRISVNTISSLLPRKITRHLRLTLS